jgi:hypothetical protein
MQAMTQTLRGLMRKRHVRPAPIPLAGRGAVVHDRFP